MTKTISAPKGYVLINGNLVSVKFAKAIINLDTDTTTYYDTEGNAYDDVKVFASASDYEKNSASTASTYIQGEHERQAVYSRDETGEILRRVVARIVKTTPNHDHSDWRYAEDVYDDGCYPTRGALLAHITYSEIKEDGTTEEHIGIGITSVLTDEQRAVVDELHKAFAKVKESGVKLFYNPYNDIFVAMNNTAKKLTSTYYDDVSEGTPMLELRNGYVLKGVEIEHVNEEDIIVESK